MDQTYEHLLRQFDSYQSTSAEFERDVYVLILNALDAAVISLSVELDVNLSSIDTALEKARGEFLQHLGDRRVEYLSDNHDQERFLRNIALVALSSRIIHALTEMAKSAESFSRRRGSYGNRNDSDFQKIWSEYRERFNIDFRANNHRIAFTEPMRCVRNKIVHSGGMANQYRAQNNAHELNDLIDYSFSEEYPQFVEGDGIGAMVNVGQEQLDSMVSQAIDLVRWLAENLRELELAWIAARNR